MFSPNLNNSRPKMQTSMTKTPGQTKMTRNAIASLTPQQRKPSTPVFGRNKSLNVSELPTGVASEIGPAHTLTEFGAPVPVAVTETLTLIKKGARLSAKVDENGWAWLVCERKLIVWQYKDVPYNKTSVSYDLLLPSSAISHDAALVAIFVAPGSQSTMSCLAVSPEGSVRYWYNASLSNSYVELNLDVRGEQCSILSMLEPPEFGCVVGTVSSTLVYIGFAQGHLGYRTFQIPKRMLSGLTKKMSSYLFGRETQETSVGLRLHKLLAGETLDRQTQALYVLTGGNLQKWAVSSQHEKFLYEMNLDVLFRDNLAHEVWQQHPSNLPQFASWIMDIQLISDGVMVLGAGVNTMVSSQVYYALGSLHTEDDDAPHSFLSFTITGYHTTYDKDDEIQFWYRFLLPNLTSPTIYLYNQETLACISVIDNRSDYPPDVVDFKNIGAGCSDGMPVFISNQGALVRIEGTRTDAASNAVELLSRTVSFSKLDTSIAATANPDKIKLMIASSDKSSRLKAAFLTSIRDAMHQLQAQVIVDDLFPVGLTPSVDAGSPLDILVVGLSQEMVDDYPASDPRWAESLPSDAASTSVSLILMHQLEDKLKAHELFLCFLKNYGLWDRLSLIPVRDGKITTRMLLCEHAEKIEATKTLRNLHIEHAALVNQAIELALDKRHRVPFNNLTPQDLFYREVSQIHEILPCLIECEEYAVSRDVDSRDVIYLISTVNAIIKEMIFAANQYRRDRESTYQSSVSRIKESEFIPWTSSTGPKGIRFVIRRQFDITVERAFPDAKSNQEKGALFGQLMDFAEMLLDGYSIQLESLSQSQQATPHYVEVLRKFEQERSAVIAPFMSHRQYERATSLAEKYCDFATLVEICEELNNSTRLRSYMEKFEDKNFSDFVFQWYMTAGKRGKLMTHDIMSNPSLGRFLRSKENQFMSWLHDIAENNYHQAHLTLLELGCNEREFLAKKKTLLSLSKLSAFAAGGETDEALHNINIINNQQDVLLHQEQLMSCPEVKEKLIVDNPDMMKVLTIPELIELYVGDHNVDANVLEFKKALDLLSFVDKNNPEINWHEMVLKIWSQAILRDSWDEPPSATDPIETCRDTLFYSLLECVISEEGNLEELLPTVEELLSCDALHRLSRRFDFQCLIQAIYEHINRREMDHQPS